jgi:hypothetical protein
VLLGLGRSPGGPLPLAMVTGHRLGSAGWAATGCEVGAGVGVACGCREQPMTTTASAAASATVRVPVRAATICSYPNRRLLSLLRGKAVAGSMDVLRQLLEGDPRRPAVAGS